MKTLHALVSGEYSDYRVVALFDDKETADKWVAAMSADEDRSYNDYRLEEMDLVEKGVEPFKTDIYHLSADLYDDGTVKNSREWVNSDWAICSYQKPMTRVDVRYVRTYSHHDKGGTLTLTGPTLESVRKVYGEKLAKWKAGEFGGPSYDIINEEGPEL